MSLHLCASFRSSSSAALLLFVFARLCKISRTALCLAEAHRALTAVGTGQSMIGSQTAAQQLVERGQKAVGRRVCATRPEARGSGLRQIRPRGGKQRRSGVRALGKKRRKMCASTAAHSTPSRCRVAVGPPTVAGREAVGAGAGRVMVSGPAVVPGDNTAMPALSVGGTVAARTGTGRGTALLGRTAADGTCPPVQAIEEKEWEREARQERLREAATRQETRQRSSQDG